MARAPSKILPLAAAAAVVYSVGQLALSFIAPPANPSAGPQLRSRGATMLQARGGGEYDVSDADIEAFYKETISGNGGDPPKGCITAELIVKFFYGEFTNKGFQRYSGFWKGPPPGTIGKKDIKVGYQKMKDFFANPNMQFISKGGIGFGVDETLKVEDDGKGYIWLAAEMSPGGLALETFKSTPYGKRALFCAKADNVQELFDKVNWDIMDKRIDTTLGGPQIKQRKTIPGKSAEELLEMYDGKEDKLIKNLEKMKSKQSIKALANKQQSVRELVDETNPGKSAEELLTMYDGKEDVLIKNLEKMKTKQNNEASKVDSAKAETIASITALVEETNPGKSAEELLAAYDGKEDELLKNLSKMKSKKDINAKTEKQAEIKALVKSTNPGKSAEELMAAYDGKEDELIKNLTKMKSKQDMKASSSSDDKQKALVRTLVKETNPGKSADDLLKAYAGREDELVAHLSKLKKSTRNIA